MDDLAGGTTELCFSFGCSRTSSVSDPSYILDKLCFERDYEKHACSRRTLNRLWASCERQPRRWSHHRYATREDNADKKHDYVLQEYSTYRRTISLSLHCHSPSIAERFISSSRTVGLGLGRSPYLINRFCLMHPRNRIEAAGLANAIGSN
jgi:hypothetical protein